MNRAKNAIILAAGKGTRLNPITLDTPKPLIKVNGKRMIDTIIEALQGNEINDIYIVVGYLKEKFEILKKEYPFIKIIENPYYNTCNNISSLYVARDYLENSIIMDADQIIYNKKIIFPNFEKSGYNCTWSEDFTNEWLLTVDENKIVQECSRSGGKKGWRLYSVSRWNAKDGKKLKKYLEEEFIDKKNTQIYWDDVAIFCHPDNFDLTIYEMNEKDMTEIDNLDELAIIDKSYEKYTKEGFKNEN